MCGLALGQNSQSACLCQPPSPETKDKAGTRPDTPRFLFISPSFPSSLSLHSFFSLSIIRGHCNHFSLIFFSFFITPSPHTYYFSFLFLLSFISWPCLSYHLTLSAPLLISRQCPEFVTHHVTHHFTHAHTVIVPYICTLTAHRQHTHTFYLSHTICNQLYIYTHSVSLQAPTHRCTVAAFPYKHSYSPTQHIHFPHTHIHPLPLSVMCVCYSVSVILSLCVGSTSNQLPNQ